jgi:hypothetical protein
LVRSSRRSPTGVPDETVPEDESDIAPEQGPVGSTAVISEDDGTGAVEVGEITVEKIEASKSWHGEYDTEYPENKWFIKVKVAAKGSKNGFDVSPSNFFIRDPSDGSRYEYADGNAISVDAEPSFDSVTLTKGEKYTGYTAFDVPAKHGVLAYSPNWGGESVFEWEF